MADEDRVLTHHVNVRNPRSGDVQTFAPGAKLPKWAHDALVAENHVAYPVSSPRAVRLVRAWEAQEALAAAAAEEDPK